MRASALFTCVSLSAMLVACAQPTQRVPKYDKAAVQQELQIQQQYAQQQASVKGQVPAISIEEATARVQRIVAKIGPAGEQICKDMYGAKRQCQFKFGLAKDGPVNAWADGSSITITPAMVAFAGDDNSTALVLAHEYAHNILQHPQATSKNAVGGAIAGALADALAASQGMDTGNSLQQLGGQYAVKRYSVAFEKEADYVGLYILARSGFDYAASPELWRRMSAYEPASMYGGDSHPSNPDRFVGLNQAIKEIEAKKASGAPLLPERKPEKKSRWGF